MRRSGARAAIAAAFLVLSACYRFAGGGLPPHIKTVAVVPFDNETSQPTLQRELHENLRREVEGRLGLRTASEDRADAVVRGKILRYDVDIPVGYSADPNRINTAQRKLQITVDVEIVDQTNGRTLLSRKGLTAEGEYGERAEPEGRRRAIDKLVADVISGAQSQW